MATVKHFRLVWVFAVLGAAVLLFVLSIQSLAGLTKSTADDTKIDRSEVKFSQLHTGEASDLSKEVSSIADDIGADGLQLDTVRFLGNGEFATYWAAFDRGENICLVAELASHTTGFSCAPLEQFNDEGTGFSIENMNTDEFLEAHLVPDNAILDNVSYVVEDVPGVAVVTEQSEEVTGEILQIPTTDDVPLSFAVLGEIPREFVHLDEED